MYILESGNNQSWIYSGLGTKIVINNSLYFMNIKKNKYLLKEDIEDMKSISLIILSFDTWIRLTYKDDINDEQLRQFLKDRSNLLISLTTKVFSTDFEYYVLCAAIFHLEAVHIAQKIKDNDFNIEDIDCLNIDILKAQHFFCKSIDDVTLVRFNDISEDFSYYLELSESNEKRKKKSSHNTLSNPYSTTNKQILELKNKRSSIEQNVNFFKINFNDNFNNSDNNNNNNINNINNQYYNATNNHRSNISNYYNNNKIENTKTNNTNKMNNNKNSNSNNNNNSSNSNNNNHDDDDKKKRDSRENYLSIIKSISQDEEFFSPSKLINDNENLNNFDYDEIRKTSYDIVKWLLQKSKNFTEQKKWMNFFLITIAERIYINRVFILDVINDTEKMKIYPIAKSIAIASKSADDCSIILKLLFEAAKSKNNLPLRFSFNYAWVFYQCTVIYILRYLATQEDKYIKEEGNEKQTSKFSIFSSFPQKTLAPCYFYLDLLKQMRNYFVNVQSYIREVKLLIYETEKSVRDKTFQVNIRDIFQ